MRYWLTSPVWFPSVVVGGILLVSGIAMLSLGVYIRGGSPLTGAWVAPHPRRGT